MEGDDIKEMFDGPLNYQPLPSRADFPARIAVSVEGEVLEDPPCRRQPFARIRRSVPKILGNDNAFPSRFYEWLFKGAHVLVLGTVLFAAILISGCKVAGSGSVRLAENGKALVPIVISPQSSDDVKKTARDLAAVLQRMTGAEFPIEESTEARGITLGTLLQYPDDTLNEPLAIRDTYDGVEAFSIRSDGGRVRLIGNTDLGVSHAASRFLEQLGCRWFFMTPTWQVVPEVPMLSFTGHEDSRPQIWSRDIWFDRLAQGGERGDPKAGDLFRDWARANRMGRSLNVRIPHSWHAIPGRVTELFDNHPEYFALVDGERQGPQFCVTNPGLQKAIITYARQMLDAQPDLHMVSLDPADTSGWCTCEDCAALGPPSVQPFFQANVAAKALQESHPGKYIGVLAYSWYSAPPPFPLERNVHIQLTRGLNAGPHTGDELYDLWSKRGNSLGIYEYYSYWQMDRNMIPGTWVTDIDRNAERIREYVTDGVVDMSAQSSGNWGIHGLAYYAANRLMWDSRTDVATLRQDFLEKAFGPAAGPMDRFYRRTSQAGNPMPGLGLLRQTVDDLQEASVLAAGHPEVLARIDDLKKLVIFSYLGEKVNVPATSYVGIKMGEGHDWEEKKAAYLDWFTWAYRIRNSHMISWLTYRSAVGNPISGQYGPEWFWRNTVKDPGKNPWRDDTPITTRELDERLAQIRAELGDVPLLPEFSASREFAFFPQGTDPGKERTLGMSGRATVLLASQAGEPLRLAVTTRPTVVRQGEGVAGVTQVREVVIDTPDARYALSNAAGEEVVSGKLPLGTTELELTVPAAGVYHFTCERPGSGWQARFPAGTPHALLVGKSATVLDVIDAPGEKSDDTTAWFFVPPGTTEILLQAYQCGEVIIRRPDGAVALESVSDGRFLRIPVGEAEDGKNWSVDLTGEMRRGQFRFLNIPTVLSLDPAYAFVSGREENKPVASIQP